MIHDVIVIGAGISGLAAAQKLVRQGLKVLMLEARDRLGGRIHTDRSLDFPVDLGASWLHDVSHNPLANHHDFQLQQFPYHGLIDQPQYHTIYDQNNRKLERGELEKIQLFAEQFFSEHYVKNDNLMQRWFVNLLSCWAGAEFNKTSPELWNNIENETEMAYVLNGYDTLINILAKNLNIQLNSAVNQINYAGNTVKVSAADQIYETKKVIISLPLGVLKNNSVIFMPALPSDKIKAINNLDMGVLDKTILQFPHCFWEEDTLSISRFPTENDSVAAYINYHALTKKPVLFAFCGGETAKKMEKMESEGQHHFFLNPLRQIYGKKFVEPIRIIPTCRYNDPYAGGSYAYLPMGTTRDCFNQLALPVADKLFFAGEATHATMNATVHGAYLSGQRAADELLALNAS